MRPVHWIETELSRHYKDVDLCEGVDLDRNGAIEGTERTDRNGDGEVDSAEWQKFVGDNKAALEKLCGYFKAYYSAGTTFKPDNLIHDLLFIESELVSPEEVKKAYDKVEDILRAVEESLSGMELSPERKLKLIYRKMEQAGIDYKNQDDSSFVRNINGRELDCDTSSFVVLTVAREFNWPVHLVHAPGHTFVRWDDGKGTKFNIDYGNFHPDSSYISWFNVSREAKALGVYLRNLDYRGELSLFYRNRGNSKYNLGRYEEAIKDYDKAIELDPNFAAAYYNRGNSKDNLGRYEEEIKDYDKAIELDPNFAAAYYNRGHSKGRLRQYEEAIKDYDKVIEFDPNFAAAYNNRGVSKGRLRQYEEAIKDCDKVIELDPNFAAAYNNRGNSKDNLGRYEEAIKDYDKAIELDPNFAAAYNNRGNSKGRLRQYEEEIKDYDKAIELDPNFAAAYYNRGNSKDNLGRYEEAIKDYDKAIELDPNDTEARQNREKAAHKLNRQTCACNTPGRTGQEDSERSLLSLLLMLFD